jgi:hypothetical protein
MGEIVSFGPDIWIVEGPVVSFYGFPYPTRTVLIRLSSGGMFVWSPIALTPVLRANVDKLGPVEYLVSPNALHHLFMGAWKTAYPAAKLYASPGLARKCRDLRFDTTLRDTPPAAWADDVDQVEMAGSFALTEIVFFHRKSRTAIFGSDRELPFRLVQRLARMAGAVGRNRNAKWRRAARMAFYLPQKSGACSAGACIGLAARAGGHRAWGNHTDKWHRIYPQIVPLARIDRAACTSSE